MKFPCSVALALLLSSLRRLSSQHDHPRARALTRDEAPPDVGG